MSDAFWTALLATAVPSAATLVMTIVLAVLSHRTRTAVQKSDENAQKNANSASAKAEEVKAQLNVTGVVTEKKLETLTKVANETHTLVNSNMEKALQIAAVALRRIAEITNNEGDMKAAELAEKALADHIEKQVKVDTKAEKQVVAAAIASSVDAQKTIGEMARETMGDVKEVKQDVKDIKKSGE